MRWLGLDLGEKRIGLAVSDEDARIAFPAGFMERKGRRRDLAALRALVREREIGGAVVGLPLHMDGRRGPEAAAAEAFARELAAAAAIPVELLDERWTSVAAERALQET
ncbi:MAG TPA: Holliday junction resolvase RuvX, partial [Myxococcota bacterium]|nr:Holliday junction resolvase RuvX [Myxococcota bacterium]